MRNLAPFFLFLFSISLSFCQPTSNLTDLNNIPKVKEEDKALANVYQLLDGKWKGQFKIFEDKKRVKKKSID